MKTEYVEEIRHGEYKCLVNIEPLSDTIRDAWRRKVFYEANKTGMLAYLYGRRHDFVGRQAIDCGSNLGNHTLFFIRVIGVSQVFSFEPQLDRIREFQKNIQLNNIHNCTLHEVALGDVDGVKANVSPNKGTITKSKEGNATIMTLDSFGDEFKNVGLIKIDVEGYGAPLLRGALGVIECHSPEVFIECQDKSSLNDARSILKGINYEQDTRFVFNATPTYRFYRAT